SPSSTSTSTSTPPTALHRKKRRVGIAHHPPVSYETDQWHFPRPRKKTLPRRHPSLQHPRIFRSPRNLGRHLAHGLRPQTRLLSGHDPGRRRPRALSPLQPPRRPRPLEKLSPHIQKRPRSLHGLKRQAV